MHVKNPRVALAAGAAALVAVAGFVLGPMPLRAPVDAAVGAPAPTGGSPASTWQDGGTAASSGAPEPAPARTRGPVRSTDGGIAPDANAAGPAVPGASTPGATVPGSLPPVVDHGPRTGRKVALTFDADMTDAMRRQLRGPNPPSYANLAIVDLLERQKVPATFFLTGKWVREYPELTRRLAANPRFELANHSYGHDAFTPDCYTLKPLPRREMTADVARTFDTIAPYGGRQTRYFRFPGLCHDRTALTELAPLGLTVVDGDVVSGDPFARYWQPIVRAVLSQARPGSVIILHVTEANAPMTDEALPHILAGLAERGLEPAPLSEVLGGTSRPAG
ncbi:polysaccharide deacetylase family protein [Micromonospora sp. KC721]|uniref:polysaccharide deacetylase family protein n=1 Tax=Micromonospora sp. KC721 TaxID=2530380 RepID=UPI00104B21C7|nr:polysaccharide deacetylase family protein [Micromonospora sp. KC721]TDB79004.1 polysaccharide deacetylase [Micromonospora sp. KC721]